MYCEEADKVDLNRGSELQLKLLWTIVQRKKKRKITITKRQLKLNSIATNLMNVVKQTDVPKNNN